MNASVPIRASQQYADAYAAHYKTKDLRGAFELYKGVIDAHRDSAEAGWSRSQILNIIRGVVPEEELFAAQADLASAHLPASSVPVAGPGSE